MCLSHATSVRGSKAPRSYHNARRLTTVITDCVGPMWFWLDLARDSGVGPVFPCGYHDNASAPVVATDSAGISRDCHTVAPARTPNRSLNVTLPWWWPDDEPSQSRVPVPVVTLEVGPVATWARMIMGVGGAETFGVFATPPTGRTTIRPEGSLPNAEERVQRYRVTVTHRLSLGRLPGGSAARPMGTGAGPRRATGSAPGLQPGASRRGSHRWPRALCEPARRARRANVRVR